MAFEFAQGTVVGRDHRLIGKNNQDGMYVATYPGLSFAVVTDGCGDPELKYSEVGARLTPPILVETILRQLRTRPLKEMIIPRFWEKVRDDVVAQLRVIVGQMGGIYEQIVRNYFLFTTLVAVITNETTVFVSFGDGTLIINGAQVPIGPFPGNMPPYLGYCLLDRSVQHAVSAEGFKIQAVLPTVDLTSFLIGSDGVLQLLEAQDKQVPGKSELVGPISQFWTEDFFFQNKDAVRRRLSLIGQDVVRLNRDSQELVTSVGLLRDDTTLIVARRKTV